MVWICSNHDKYRRYNIEYNQVIKSSSKQETRDEVSAYRPGRLTEWLQPNVQHLSQSVPEVSDGNTQWHPWRVPCSELQEVSLSAPLYRRKWAGWVPSALLHWRKACRSRSVGLVAVVRVLSIFLLRSWLRCSVVWDAICSIWDTAYSTASCSAPWNKVVLHGFLHTHLP